MNYNLFIYLNIFFLGELSPFLILIFKGKAIAKFQVGGWEGSLYCTKYKKRYIVFFLFIFF